MDGISDRLTVATLGKPHGVSGLLKLRFYSETPPLLSPGQEVWLRFSNGIRRLTLERAVPMGREWLVHFRGVDTPEAARSLTGGDLLLSRSELPPCQPNEFFAADLIGCRLCVKGQPVGTVTGFLSGGASDLLEVHTDSGQLRWVPFLSQFIGEISLDNRTIDLLESWFLE